MPAERVWATLLCVCMLRSQPFSLLAAANEGPVENDRTIVDTAEGWLEAQALRSKPLEAALPALRECADDYVKAWEQEQALTIAATIAGNRQYNLMRNREDLRRMAAFSLLKLWRTQEALGAVLSKPTEPLRRHERSVMLLTHTFVLLAVDIWIYQQKGLTCCLEARALLGCDPNLENPCRGFTGDCGLLRSQFAAVPELAAALGGDGASCGAFPDDSVWWHRLAVAALLVAVLAPVRFCLGRGFQLVNDPPGLADVWLQWRGIPRFAMGRMGWGWAQPPGSGGGPSVLQRLVAKLGQDPDMLLWAIIKRSLGLQRRDPDEGAGFEGRRSVGGLQEGHRHSSGAAEQRLAAHGIAAGGAGGAGGLAGRPPGGSLDGRPASVSFPRRPSLSPTTSRGQSAAAGAARDARMMAPDVAERGSGAGEERGSASGDERGSHEGDEAQERHDEIVSDGELLGRWRVVVYLMVYLAWSAPPPPPPPPPPLPGLSCRG